MGRICIFLFLTIFGRVITKEEYVPALIWTSREYQGRKNVDYLVLKKIKSELFESFIMELLGGAKPVIAVFLEHVLGPDDFEWRDQNGENSFPFLSDQTVNSRVDYFRSVESPYQTLSQLYSKGFRKRYLKPGVEFEVNEGELLIFGFPVINSQRPETLKTHDQQMEEIHRRLIDSGKSWVSVYTARHTDNRYFLGLKHLSPWIVEDHLQDNPTKALSLYRDEFTGYTLITKGSLQLFLPSTKNLVLKTLDSYLGASAKISKDGIDFVIWFSNYTLTLYLNRVKGEWVIGRAKLLNGNGDTLNLTLSQEEAPPRNKCVFQITEFQSEGKPTVKVALSKYKFMKLENVEDSCKKPYGFQITFSIIFFSIISAVVCWNKLLESWKFPRHTKIVRISTDDLLLFGDALQDL